MLREAAARLSHAFHRYFSVKPAEVAPEVRAASESASKAVAAAVANMEASRRLADELSKLDGIMRHGGQ